MGLVELARFETRVAADLARLGLEAEGKLAVVFDAETNSFFGGDGMVEVRLMVLDEERDAVAAILSRD